MAFEAYLSFSGTTATLHLGGDLMADDVTRLRALLDQLAARTVGRVVLRLQELTSVTGGAVRALALGQQQLPPGAEVIVDGASFPVRRALRFGGLEESMSLVDSSWPPAAG
ncbi:anti-sigma factor antagonist [Streptomyces polygonati]|uniref:Anti-sigma factor antagonist n=1 Tax=Streptomyces polygonati TaxID=1617087 RepID=A0ABV8HXF9_9ACTN